MEPRDHRIQIYRAGRKRTTEPCCCSCGKPLDINKIASRYHIEEDEIVYCPKCYHGFNRSRHRNSKHSKDLHSEEEG